MAIRDQSTSGYNCTPLERVLAGVLLVGIIYSATFAFVHSHGNVSATANTDISATSTGQAGFSTFVPFHKRSDGYECLICVLHQQFSSSTVHSPHFTIGPSVQESFISAPAPFHYSGIPTSLPVARLSGRAPPFFRPKSVIRFVDR